MSTSHESIQQYLWRLDQIRFSLFSAEKIDHKKVASIETISNIFEENISKKGDILVYSQQGKLSGVELTEKLEFEINCQGAKLDFIFNVDDSVDRSYSAKSMMIISKSLLSYINDFIHDFSKFNKIVRVAFSVTAFPDVDCASSKDTMAIAKKILPFMSFNDDYEACDLKFTKKCAVDTESVKVFNNTFSVSSVTFVSIKKDMDLVSLDFERLKKNACLFHIDLSTDRQNEDEIKIVDVVKLYDNFIDCGGEMIMNGVIL